MTRKNRRRNAAAIAAGLKSGRPKGIRTAYIMFVASEGPRIRKELSARPDLQEPGTFGKYMGLLWKSMTEQDKVSSVLLA